MKQKSITLILCVLCLLSFTACGYNNIMYKHLSNIDNYESYTAVIEQIYVVDKDSNRAVEYNKNIHGSRYLKDTVYIDILPEGIGYSVRVEIIPQNSQILFDNGFFDTVEEGFTINVQTSLWTYMDGEFNFVIGLSYDDVQYLNSEDGLDNIIKMMDADRSFF
ncbi:MAG: hypothetical protein J6Q24_03345 [Clostridia bacterium]|nr:hypothetical protein [Clostridia bacterium]